MRNWNIWNTSQIQKIYLMRSIMSKTVSLTTREMVNLFMDVSKVIDRFDIGGEIKEEYLIKKEEIDEN
jgi:hypothetical protein